MVHRYVSSGQSSIQETSPSCADPAVRDALFDAVFTVDRRGRIVDANVSGTAVVGCTSAELQGRDVRDVIRLEGGDGDRIQFESLVDDGDVCWTGWMQRTDSSAVAAEARVVRSSPTRFMIIAREKFERTLEDSLDMKLDESASLRGGLSKNILESLNHEFRTPLTAILGFAQVVKDVVEPQYQPIIEDIERSGNRLLESFVTLIEFGKARTGEYPLYPRLQDVSESVLACAARVERLAKDKGLEIDVRCDRRPLIAFVDEQALKRVVHAVVDNAFKFTESGSVDVRLSATSDTIEIVVSDTGVGISPEFMPHLFDAFTQESTGLNRIYQGAGMGLALSLILVQLMEGRILVQSAKGIGSRFTIILPRSREAGMN